jgi:uncharacterized protein (DUF1778 family)
VKEESGEARLEARISAEQKQFFQHAAAVRGTSLTDFMVSSLQEAAVQAVRDYEVLTLSVTGRERLIENLMNPPKANPALRKAAHRHREVMGK